MHENQVIFLTSDPYPILNFKMWSTNRIQQDFNMIQSYKIIRFSKIIIQNMKYLRLHKTSNAKQKDLY